MRRYYGGIVIIMIVLQDVCAYIMVVVLLLLLLLFCVRLVAGCSPRWSSLVQSTVRPGGKKRSCPDGCDGNDSFCGQKSSWRHGIRLLASENLPEWQLSEGCSVLTHVYTRGSRVRPVETRHA